MLLLKLTKHLAIETVLFLIVLPLCRLTGRTVVHFLHVGKTGGTAIKAAFGAYPIPVRILRGNVVLFHKHSATFSWIPLGDKVVLFLRDPLARFLSGFNGCLRKGRPTRFVPWTLGEKRAFARFRTADSLGRALSSTAPAERKAAYRAMNAIEHLSLQSRWVPGGCQQLRKRQQDILLIGTQERLSSDFEKFKELVGAGVGIELPQGPVVANRAPEQLSDQLSQEARRNLERWYNCDYALLKCARQLVYDSRSQ